MSEAPPLDGVVGALLFYPYCGFGALSGGGWKRKVPSLMLLADLARDGLEAHTYPGIDHCFDMPSEKGSKLVFVPEAAKDAHERVAAFLTRVLQK